MSVRHIKIADEFSTRLGPRYPKDGPFSGEEFRKNILAPAFRDHAQVVVDLDGLLGYGASFLEEAFGGLVRAFGFTAVSAKLSLRSIQRPYLVDRIERYMRQAAEVENASA